MNRPVWRSPSTRTPLKQFPGKWGLASRQGSEQSLVKPQLGQVILHCRCIIRAPHISQVRSSALSIGGKARD